MSNDDLKDVIPVWNKAEWEKVQAAKALAAPKLQEDVICFAAKYAAEALAAVKENPSIPRLIITIENYPLPVAIRDVLAERGFIVTLVELNRHNESKRALEFDFTTYK